MDWLPQTSPTFGAGVNGCTLICSYISSLACDNDKDDLLWN
jgi:hypothetical protein